MSKSGTGGGGGVECENAKYRIGLIGPYRPYLWSRRTSERPNMCATYLCKDMADEVWFGPMKPIWYFLYLYLYLWGNQLEKQSFKCPYRSSVYRAGSWKCWQMAPLQRVQVDGSGRRFHSATTLWLKEYFLMSGRDLVTSSFLVCPRRKDPLFDSSKNCSFSIFSFSVNIFYRGAPIIGR